jgi:hypothetical protein
MSLYQTICETLCPTQKRESPPPTTKEETKLDELLSKLAIAKSYQKYELDIQIAHEYLRQNDVDNCEKYFIIGLEDDYRNTCRDLTKHNNTFKPFITDYKKYLYDHSMFDKFEEVMFKEYYHYRFFHEELYEAGNELWCLLRDCVTFMNEYFVSHNKCDKLKNFYKEKGMIVDYCNYLQNIEHDYDKIKEIYYINLYSDNTCTCGISARYLAKYYHDVEKNIEKMKEIYKISISMKNEISMYDYAMYVGPYEGNFEEMKQYLYMSVGASHELSHMRAKACIALGKHFYDVENNKEKALYWFKYPSTKTEEHRSICDEYIAKCEPVKEPSQTVETPTKPVIEPFEVEKDVEEPCTESDPLLGDYQPTTGLVKRR